MADDQRDTRKRGGTQWVSSEPRLLPPELRGRVFCIVICALSPKSSPHVDLNIASTRPTFQKLPADTREPGELISILMEGGGWEGLAGWLVPGVHLLLTETHSKKERLLQAHCVPENQKLPSLVVHADGPLSTLMELKFSLGSDPNKEDSPCLRDAGLPLAAARHLPGSPSGEEGAGPRPKASSRPLHPACNLITGFDFAPFFSHLPLFAANETWRERGWLVIRKDSRKYPSFKF